WLGSVRGVVGSNGQLLGSADYDPFGNLLTTSGVGTGGRYAWTGRELDAESGLYSMLTTRQYDPKIGRFTSEDPLGYQAGDSNLYRYVHNSPTNHTDRSGLDGWEDYIPAPLREVYDEAKARVTAGVNKVVKLLTRVTIAGQQ